MAGISRFEVSNFGASPPSKRSVRTLGRIGANGAAMAYTMEGALLKRSGNPLHYK
jgi:hypothetical protein